MRAPLTLVLVTALAAGCVAAVDAPLAPASLDRAPLVAVPGLPVVQEHDHTDPAFHNGSFGVDVLGSVTAWGDGTVHGGGDVNELVVQGDFVYMSRSGPEGGFVVVDASNPLEPRVVGEWLGEGGDDIEVTFDGMFVLLFSQRTVPAAAAVAESPLDHTPRGIFLVDVSDKTRPRYESFFPLPTNGPHTGAYHRTGDGRELLAVQTYDLVATPVANVEAANPATQRVLILELDRSGPKAVLRPLSAYQVTEPPPAGRLHFPHDSFFQVHPVTERLLLYVAYWDAGLRILDVTDPTRPEEIGRFDDFAPSAVAALHYAESFPVLVAGRHVTVVAPEIVTAPESGQITLVDTTDPTRPTKLGHFTIPGELVVDAPFRFSPHNFDLDPFGRIYWGHNHAGLWVLDVGSEERLREPVAIAFHEPDTSARTDRPIQMRVWGAMWQDGVIYVSEGSTGLHLLRLAKDALPPLAPGSLPPSSL